MHGDSYADESWEKVVVVEQHGILIGCYRAFSQAYIKKGRILIQVLPVHTYTTFKQTAGLT